MVDYWADRNPIGDKIKDNIDGIQCIDKSKLYIQSEELSSLQAKLEIVYEHCIETDPPVESCMNATATKQFWDDNKFFMQIDYLQLDMKDIENPMKKYSKFLILNHEYDKL